MFGALARGVKDTALSMSLKKFVGDKFADYGEITDCAINTKDNSVTLQAKLKGERESVTATIERYELERDGEDTYIVLKKFSASREWLSMLMSKILTDKRYRLPSAVTKLL